MLIEGIKFVPLNSKLKLKSGKKPKRKALFVTKPPGQTLYLRLTFLTLDFNTFSENALFKHLHRKIITKCLFRNFHCTEILVRGNCK